MRTQNFQLSVVDAGRLKLDGGAMFGAVPKELWKHWTPADDHNRIELSTRSLLIQCPNRVLLIDGGIGSHWDHKFQSMFCISANPLEQTLHEDFGIKPEQVTDIIVTHWHFDHVGGLIKKDSNDEVLPVFSEAQVHVQLANQKYAESPSDREKASYMSQLWKPYEQLGQLCLSSLPASLEIEEIIPGVFVQRSDGHTIGQQIVHIVDDGIHFVFCADLIPTQHHLKPHYSMGYDLQPLILEKEKRELLRQAAQSGWVLIFEHDSKMSAAKVHQAKTSKGLAYELEPYDL